MSGWSIRIPVRSAEFSCSPSVGLGYPHVLLFPPTVQKHALDTLNYPLGVNTISRPVYYMKDAPKEEDKLDNIVLIKLKKVNKCCKEPNGKT